MARDPLQCDRLRVDMAEGIATVALNRPAQHNALSRALRCDFLKAARSKASLRGPAWRASSRRVSARAAARRCAVASSRGAEQ